MTGKMSRQRTHLPHPSLQINNDVIEHHPAGNQLDARAAHEPQEGADRGLERRPGPLPFDEKLRLLGAEIEMVEDEREAQKFRLRVG